MFENVWPALSSHLTWFLHYLYWCFYHNAENRPITCLIVTRYLFWEKQYAMVDGNTTYKIIMTSAVFLAHFLQLLFGFGKELLTLLRLFITHALTLWLPVNLITLLHNLYQSWFCVNGDCLATLLDEYFQRTVRYISPVLPNRFFNSIPIRWRIASCMIISLRQLLF